MFNIYIYDYCYKRGFRKTAQELLLEADIPSDSTPPINARQGLLFEWWSVFWVLFTAKANGNGTEDAMLYTQHQAHQTSLKQNQNRPPPPQPMPMPPSQMQAMGRGGVNGIAPQRGFAPNGVMPNGIPQGNGQPPGPTAFVGGGMQPNGMMSGPPQPPGMGAQFMGQRPPQMGGPPRAPNGGPPFQSPTMAHSPPNPGQQPQPPQQHGAPPMGQLGPPHRGMLPPGQQGMNPGQPGMNPGQQTPTSSYQNIGGRPPSRSSTPQGMMNPSPSMVSRQPMVPGGDPREMNNNELQSIPMGVVNVLKADLGLGDKNIHQLTLHDKQRILMLHKQRSQKPGQASNAAAGPSMQAPPQRRSNKRNSTSPGEDPQQPDDGRNGSSPKRVRRSPMEQQISAPGMGYQQHPNQPQSQPGGPGGPQQGMGNGMMRPMGGPMNGGFPQPGQPNMQGMPGSMGMLGNMNPMMSNMPNSMPNTMSPQMHAQTAMYRQGMHMQHQNRMGGMSAGSPGSDPSFNPGVPMPPGAGGPGPGQQGPPGGQGQFAPGSRLAGPPNAKPMSMLPPPSPAKDQNVKQENKGPPNGHPEGSPRNQPLLGPNPPGTAPPTPGPNQGQPGQQGQGQGPGQNTAPSPGMMINPNPGSMNPVAMALPPAPSSADNLFSTDFIQSVAGGLDEFDVGMFRGDGDINFERDFGQWFNPDDVGGSMELGKQ